MLHAKSNENANSEVSPAHTSFKGIQFGKVIKLRLFKSGENYVKMPLLAWLFIKPVLPQRLVFFPKSFCFVSLKYIRQRYHTHTKKSEFQMFWENTNT